MDLQNLTHATINIKRLLAPSLFDLLPGWQTVFQDEENRSQSEHRLTQVLSILDDVFEGQDRAVVAESCGHQFLSHPSGPLALAWLRGLFRFDPEQATRALEDSLASISADGVRSGDYVIEIFASLFGPRGIALDFPNSETRATLLGRLVRCAYRYVRPAEDQGHEGSPDTRHDAERARDSLVASLLDTSGEDAQKVMHDLESLFAHHRDRLRLLARQRAAKDAEHNALRPEEVVAFEEGYEVPPCDRDGLFEVMMDRLNDLADDIAHHDFSDRRTLQKIEEESDLQLTLAYRLERASRGAYLVSREEEVADRKETDIQLVATHGDARAAIEVKRASAWSLRKLEQALRNQLVEQYLRHASRKAGCLLLTYEGKKRFWKHPKGSAVLGFAEVVDHLQCLARAIEQEMNDEVRLAVYPIDLRDPQRDAPN